jgi:hypothetical protein
MAHRFGTNIRKSFDQDNFRKAARSVGADLRYWSADGTVATVDTETGEFDPTDTHAIYNASDGVDVDVKLEPLGIPVTCRYAGISAGEVTILAPIRPGDLVHVELPDGDATTPIITKILASRSNRQPTENGTPLFDNHRLLIHARSVPIDIRLAGAPGATPVRLLLEQDGTVTVTAGKVKLGSDAAAEQYVEGTSYRGAEDQMLDTLRSGLAALQAAAVGPLAALEPGFASCVAAIVAFQTAAAASNKYLSQKVFGE